MLSDETIASLEAAKAAIEEYLEKRTGEIDDLVTNLRAYGVPLDSLSVTTTETATTEALEAINDLLG